MKGVKNSDKGGGREMEDERCGGKKEGTEGRGECMDGWTVHTRGKELRGRWRERESDWINSTS